MLFTAVLSKYFHSVVCNLGVRGGVVVKALRYKLANHGSIPDGVIGIFQ